MNPMQAMPQQAPMGGRPPMGGQPPMGPMGGPPMGGGPQMGGPQAGFSMPARGINLFKVQEQLKDMPQQAVMAYANGQNPDLVPPYIALGEMERRTRAAKNAQPSQAPQGTVKDNLEQQIKQAAGLASLAGQKQQQMQQQQMSQSMQAPGPVPGNLPPPEDQAEPPVMMAASGGLATLPVRDRMVSYRDGGIVGYATGDLVKAPDAPAFNRMRFSNTPLQNPDVDEEGLPRSREERARILELNARLSQRQREEQAANMRPSKAGIEFREQFQKPDAYPQGPVSPIQTTASQGPTGSFLPTATLDASIEDIKDPIERARARQARDNQIKAGKLTMPPQTPIPGQGAPSAAPAGLASLPGAPAAPTTPGAGAPGAAPGQQNPFAAEFLKDIKDSRELSAKVAAPPPPPTPEQQALLNMPVEQDNMKRLRELAAKRNEEDVRLRADIEERKSMDLTRAMLAGAEASRGYKGLGSLAAGFGRSSLDSRSARMGEEAALRSAGLTRAELLEQAQFEMDTLQRARAEGNREKEQASREKLLGIEQALSTSRVQGLASVTGSEIGADSRAEVGAARAEVAKANAELASIDRAKRLELENLAKAEAAWAKAEALFAKEAANPIFMGTGPTAIAKRKELEDRKAAKKREIWAAHHLTIPETPGATSSGGKVIQWGSIPTK